MSAGEAPISWAASSSVMASISAVDMGARRSASVGFFLVMAGTVPVLWAYGHCVEHDQPFGHLTGEDFEQLPSVVGTEEEDPVFMSGIFAIAFAMA